ncbi:hypothetical protein GGR56DRAFT_674273 [Xylariaceae sp. FL0804]|nr:hypothetical protein GGR56DRAFT_674273 [Xylariaceae sp. FL0804]
MLGIGAGGASRRPSKPPSRPDAVASVPQLIESLQTHRVNTLTELCRIERVAAECEDEEDARAFQAPMTAAWEYYVASNQFLTELRGLTRDYPISGEVVEEALHLVRNDPESNRSWNLAWLCLVKMRDGGLLSAFAQSEAWRREMWGGRDPTEDEADQLARCFEYEWIQAVTNMLRHWASHRIIGSALVAAGCPDWDSGEFGISILVAV